MAQISSPNIGLRKYLGLWSKEVLMKDSVYILARCSFSQWKFLKALHDSFHIGRDVTMTMINKFFIDRRIAITIKNIYHAYTLCAYNNPGQKPSLPLLIEPTQ